MSIWFEPGILTFHTLSIIHNPLNIKVIYNFM